MRIHVPYVHMFACVGVRVHVVGVSWKCARIPLQLRACSRSIGSLLALPTLWKTVPASPPPRNIVLLITHQYR